MILVGSAVNFNKVWHEYCTIYTKRRNKKLKLTKNSKIKQDFTKTKTK